MHVSRIEIELPLRLFRSVAEVRVLGARRDVDRAKELRLLDRSIEQIARMASNQSSDSWRFTEGEINLMRQTGTTEWTLLLSCAADAVKNTIAKIETDHAAVSRRCPRPLPKLTFSILGEFLAGTDRDELLDMACPLAMMQI